jgi:hypothetical protein
MIDKNTSNTQQTPKLVNKILKKLLHILIEQYFIVGFILVVLVGSLAPSIGSDYGPLAPQITTDWIAVIVSFINFLYFHDYNKIDKIKIRYFFF